VLTAILKTSAVMVPIAALVTVALNLLEPPVAVAGLILFLLCLMVAPLSIHFDPQSGRR
jgi:hypothetical protein